MKYLIKKILMLFMFSSLFTTLRAQSLVTTDYWFEGYVYEQNGEGVPFLTIVLSEKGSDIPKSVTMSSDIGYISFKEVPIDIYKDHILSVYSGNKLLGQYIREGFKKKPTFVGNLNTHIELHESPRTFQTEQIIPTTEDESLTLQDFLSKCDMEVEDVSIFAKDAIIPFRLFLNGMPLDQEKMTILLGKVPMKMIKQIMVTKYAIPNSYFYGAISVLLNTEHMAAFPKDISLHPLKKF